MNAASMILGLALAGAASGACGAMLPEATPDAVLVSQAEFVWDAAPEPVVEGTRMIMQAAPEPRGWLMLLCGIGAIFALQRRRPPLFK
jgi:MYXO-CTERM domain-containing protein